MEIFCKVCKILSTMLYSWNIFTCMSKPIFFGFSSRCRTALSHLTVFPLHICSTITHMHSDAAILGFLTGAAYSFKTCLRFTCASQRALLRLDGFSSVKTGKRPRTAYMTPYDFIAVPEVILLLFMLLVFQAIKRHFQAKNTICCVLICCKLPHIVV